MQVTVTSSSVFPREETYNLIQDITSEIKKVYVAEWFLSDRISSASWVGWIWDGFNDGKPDEGLIRATCFNLSAHHKYRDMKFADTEALRFIFDEPLDKMPLHINNWELMVTGGIARKYQIAKFRLKCGV